MYLLLLIQSGHVIEREGASGAPYPAPLLWQVLYGAHHHFLLVATKTA